MGMVKKIVEFSMPSYQTLNPTLPITILKVSCRWVRGGWSKDILGFLFELRVKLGPC